MKRVEELLKDICNCDALTSDIDINKYIAEKVKCVDDKQLAHYLTVQALVPEYLIKGEMTTLVGLYVKGIVSKA